MRVTATGESTALAHIIAAVQRAQTSRADIQRIGDRVSSVFVPVVVAIAITAALWWGLAPESAGRIHDWFAPFLWRTMIPTGAAASFIVAAAVLIVACPCAMGLATPVAIMAGANAAARRGILIRDGVALEKAGKITAIVLDKTGTLTSGGFAITGPWTPDDQSQRFNTRKKSRPRSRDCPTIPSAKSSPALHRIISIWKTEGNRGGGLQAGGDQKQAGENPAAGLFILVA